MKVYLVLLNGDDDRMSKSQKPSLSRESKKIFEGINSLYILEDDGQLLLKIALEALDRLREAQEIVRNDGVILTDPSGRKRAHPALQVEKEARLAFLRAWAALSLDVDPPLPIGRPPGR